MSGTSRSEALRSVLCARGRPASGGGTSTRTGSSLFIVAMPSGVRSGDRKLACAEVDQAGCDHPSQERENPGLRMVLEQTVRAELGQTQAAQPFVVRTVEHVGYGREARAPLVASNTGQSLSDQQRFFVGGGPRRAVPASFFETLAHVAVTTAAERLLLVAEVPQDEIVAAAARFDVSHQVEKEAPLLLHVRGVLNAARVSPTAETDQAPPKPEVPRAGEQEPVRGLPVAPCAPTS